MASANVFKQSFWTNVAMVLAGFLGTAYAEQMLASSLGTQYDSEIAGVGVAYVSASFMGGKTGRMLASGAGAYTGYALAQRFGISVSLPTGGGSGGETA